MAFEITSRCTVRFGVDLGAVRAGELLRLGEAVRVVIREAGDDPTLARWDRDQNYARYPLGDGRAMVLEAIVASDTTDERRRWVRVGYPVALLAGAREHQVVLRITPAVVELEIDGEIRDEQWPTHAAVTWRGEAEGAVKGLVVEGGAEIEQEHRQDWPVKSAQYFAPPGHNAWAGDTMCLTHEGVFHLFYLFDRRHGASKFGGGGHQIAHVSSHDLRTWTHHPMPVPITETWMTCGTGIPIVQNGEILLFFGLHTDRMVPKEQTCAPEIEKTLARTGQTEPVPFMRDGKYPQGTVVARSRDGLRFAIDPTIVHHCQNPSPFVDPTTGRVYLLAGYGDEGCYATDDLRHWRLVDKHFLPNVKDTPQGNTLECQCFFEWNGWYYLIAGRSGFWMARRPMGPYWEGAKDAAREEVVRPRWDPYDGLWVPTVATWAGNRRIMAGWLSGPDVDWAGHLVLREFVQQEDGTLGTKWPAEVVPAAGEPVRAPQTMTVTADAGFVQLDAGPMPESCRISMRVVPGGNGVYGMRIGDCELKFSPVNRRAQWGTVSGAAAVEDLPTLEEILAQEPYQPIWSNPHPNLRFKGGDFTIQNVEGLDKPFKLDLIVLYDAKSGSTIIDACIDQRRTMITRRPGQRGGALRVFAQGTTVRFGEVTVRPLV